MQTRKTNFLQISRSLEMPDYFGNSFNHFADWADFTGKSILEIGGSSIPESFVFDILNAKNWTSVDIINHEAGSYQARTYPAHYEKLKVRNLSDFTDTRMGRYEIFDGAFERLPKNRMEAFDIAISVNCFEHVSDLPLVLDCAYEKLSAGGMLLAEFGPIWSSIKGSHFWINDSLNFMKPGDTPGWAHLLMSETELESYLTHYNHNQEVTRKIVHQHYHSNFINRLFAEDYEAIFRNSKFEVLKLEKLWSFHPPGFIQDALASRHGHRDYSAIGIFVVMKKAER